MNNSPRGMEGVMSRKQQDARGAPVDGSVISAWVYDHDGDWVRGEPHGALVALVWAHGTGWRVWMPGSPVGSQPFARGRETGAAGRAAADAALRAAGVLEAGRSVVKSL